ncbi:hypothetical protein F5Y05DRAFT_417267 [Hypoxylon sp. FL0543]|nr:hypothetical protein F5Y05DRAFT_417267 [Hypoxylon sp. FL0543]
MLGGKCPLPQRIPAKRPHDCANDEQSSGSTTQSTLARRTRVNSANISDAELARRSARLRLRSPTRLRALEEARQRALQPGLQQALAQARQRAQQSYRQTTDSGPSQSQGSHENNAFDRSPWHFREDDDSAAINNATIAMYSISSSTDMSSMSLMSLASSPISSTSLNSMDVDSSISSTDSSNSVDSITTRHIVVNYLKTRKARRAARSNRQVMREDSDSPPPDWSHFKDINWNQGASIQPREPTSPRTPLS